MASEMPSNVAAWLVAEKANPLEIKPSEFALPAADEIVIKNSAVAINPIDWKLQTMARFPLQYPAVLGEDVAGEVVAVGQNAASRFRKGDRVAGFALGFTTPRACDGGYQQYSVVLARLASHIPENLSFEHAAAIPLATATAAAGLFQKNYLALHPPSMNPTPTGQTLLVWGGASSVGSSAVQLAVAAGYEVFTTASPRNFERVKALGVAQVFDYAADDVVKQIVTALAGKKLAGVLDVINKQGDAISKCVEVVRQTPEARQVISTVGPILPKLEGIETIGIFASTIKDNEVSRVIYEDFLPAALKGGQYKAAVDIRVVGHGLESIQTALDEYAKGVSATKLVVTL
ncbi:hypothetical protein ASPZODRAFT_136056 [Penicilliopsis zonata CBS 506.65]|uniref:Enoyl reductase (ER) domain-containing protein n=1 Tax=Penicilliopsis zonata CBS 506.65 TaxID=1073090 RepID=A0A1L9S8V7_9EURO|nr:hypothetical protein ASPZODRAFT_136056 [Penicilliopsis zonata CBS 506.65]OJJ43601.1 hypothetical protein ASPZODRAFT_136056 [Penicilliopsis zonata CBS 506.65]